MPNIPVLRLNQLARVKEVTQNLIKDFDVGVLTGGVGALDPYQVPPQDADTQLVAKDGLAVVPVGSEGVPLHCYSLLWEAEANCINCNETVV